MWLYGLIDDNYKIVGKHEENFSQEEKRDIESILVKKIKNISQDFLNYNIDSVRYCMSRYDF